MPNLKIRIFGVCLATPLSNETEPKTIEKITVLTPQSARSKIASDGKTQIDALYTYFLVKSNNVPGSSKRKADHLLGPQEEFSAFMLHREEITLSVDKKDRVRLPYGEAGFPDSPTAASKDPRWICNLPSLLNGVTISEKLLNPVGTEIPSVVEARLVSQSGEFTGEFPCGIKGKMKMQNADVERFFAQEMALTIDLPDGEVLLQSQPFDGGPEIQPIQLRSTGGNPIEIFLVCAPLITMADLSIPNTSPCEVVSKHHHDAEVDYEFEVLWELINLPENAKKPVPELIKQQGTREDCVPGAA
jgi:hypothetical protein